MSRTYTYQRYLTAKTTVDDRALNAHVMERLRAALPAADRPLEVLEVGAGIGTMVRRMIEAGLLESARYSLLDADRALLTHAARWLPAWAERRGMTVREPLRLGGVQVVPLHSTFEAFLTRADGPPAVDLLIANAFLDLVDVPATLPKLLARAAPGGLAWLTINFDGESIFEPAHPLDPRVWALYHRSMDERTRDGHRAGDSKSGRHLFAHIAAAGGELLAAGSSDWVVFAQGGAYPADEAYFLHHIVHTIEEELGGHPELPAAEFRQWARLRHDQIDRAQLVYIAHQLDFLARRGAD